MIRGTDPFAPVFQTVSIIGMGLIGGSMAKLIRHHRPETAIYALDRSEVLSAAQQEGIVNAVLTNVTDPRIAQSDLVVLGAHVEQNKTLLSQLAASHSAPLTVMDLGSTKRSIIALAEQLSGSIEFIGGHPLAGREVSGFSNSRREIFEGKRFLISPCRNTSPQFQNRVVAWIEQLQMRPVVVSAEEHDQLMGLVSHFPQFYAVALANLLNAHDPDTALHFLGGGIDDQMRLMASPYAMWGDVLHDNQDNLLGVISTFQEILAQMKQAIETQGLESWFETSQSIYHAYLDHKASGISSPFPS